MGLEEEQILDSSLFYLQTAIHIRFLKQEEHRMLMVPQIAVQIQMNGGYKNGEAPTFETIYGRPQITE